MMGYTFRVQKTFALQAVWALLVLAVATPLTFWGVSLEEVWRIMREADWRPIALAVVLFVLTLAAKSARWQIFFEPGIRFSSILSALIIGVVVNFFLPARLGEVARLYVLRRREHAPGAQILGTIGAEKLVDLVALFALTLAITPFVPLPDWLRDPSLRVSMLALGAILLIAVSIVLNKRLQTAGRWLKATFFRRAGLGIARQAHLTLAGFAPLRQRKVLPIGLWTFVIWAMMIATNWILFLALPMRPSWLIATVLLIVLQVGVAVPSVPGKIGIYQALVNLTLALFGISRELALSYGMLLYLVNVIPELIVMVPFAWQEVYRLREPLPTAQVAE
ncbi:MAG: flippase-like domain-containing protein [Chloroflexi bacterium]|nr:MAG: flippase-like domain-containing protein [Chloroflexota bacterium]